MKHSRRDPLEWLDSELAALDTAGLRRRLHAQSRRQPGRIVVAGREYLDFSSNDYLGLATDPLVIAAASNAAAEFGWGAGASPLVTGHTAAHQQLAHNLARFEGSEAALVFASGYAANVGTITALAGSEDIIYSDAHNHASMIDGCRLSRAHVRVYPHGDVGALERMLETTSGLRRRVILSESVFSMGGDLAPLQDLVELAGRFDAMLVDEAHATGVFGPTGRGLAEALGVEDQIPVRIGTLSKAVGSVGGFVAGSQTLIDWLTNRARTFVFSTALPPAACAAAAAALGLIEREPQRGEHLLANSQRVRQTLQRQGWQLGDSQSQIIPLIVREAEQTMRLSAALRELGLWVPAIRPPSVAPGGSLLRISLTSGHTIAMMDALTNGLEEWRGRFYSQ